MKPLLFLSLTSECNYQSAWDKVRSKLGAPGVDRVSIEEFERNLQENLTCLRQSVMDGSYEPLPLLTFERSKKDGQSRLLNIPTVRDRVVQQALLLAIQPLYEKIFLNCSYAYRPGKSAQKAVERVERNLKRGRVWIVNADIENFFDTIDRTLLMQVLAESLPEEKILKIIAKSIDVLKSPTGKGIAQGMVLAPLLSNVYLHKMDEAMVRADWNYIRYSDNILVLNKTEEQAKEALERLEKCLGELLLKLNPQKTAIMHIKQGFSFLGFYFDEHGKRPGEAALQRLNERIGGALQKTIEYSEGQLRDKIESIIRGWLNYFQLEGADRQQLLKELEMKFAGQEKTLAQKILQSAIMYSQGNTSEAQSILQAEKVEISEDADMNYQWGVLCSVLGLQNESIDSFLAAYRNNSEHPEAAFMIGLHYLKQNDLERAIRYLQKSVQNNPQNGTALFALGAALENMALHGAAKRTFERAFQLDPNLKKIASAQRTREQKSEVQAKTCFRNEDIDLVLGTFSGREGVFAKQWLSDNGRSGYQTIYRPMGREDVLQHLQGNETLAFYLMRSDNTVQHLIIDIDVTKQVRTEILSSEDQIEQWKKLLWDDVFKLTTVFTQIGIKAYVEDSGFKGMHLWVFFAMPQPARQVILLANRVLSSVGACAPGLQREVFPKEAHVAPDALGSMIKLPLGVHKLSGKRCAFFDSHAQPLADPFLMLKELDMVSANKLYQVLDQLKKPFVQDVSKAEDRVSVEKIIQGCNIIRHLLKKAGQEKMLSHVDRLTLLGVFGPLQEPGRKELHSALSQTLNYSYHITEKWFKRRKGLPLSCPKIRLWQSHITPAVGCYCKLPEMKNSYPSPVLHADPEMVVKLKEKTGAENKITTAAGHTADGKQKPVQGKNTFQTIPAMEPKVAFQDKAEPIQDLNLFIRDYFQVKRDLHRIGNEACEMEERLNAHFEQHKLEKVETEWGDLKRIKEGDSHRWIIEI